jgi:hypothetical protein
VHWSQVKERIAETVPWARFDPEDGHALDGIIDSPMAEDLASIPGPTC